MKSPRTLWTHLTETRGTLRPPGSGPTSDRSLVAGANAVFRAHEAGRPEGDRILHDPWAHRFVERHPLVQLIRQARVVLPPLRRELDRLQVAHCTRHRSIDVLVERAIAEGFGQVVILGAGYDSRCQRIEVRVGAYQGQCSTSGSEVGGPVRWFEVDTPSTLGRKAGLLGTSTPATWVLADLNQAGLDLLQRLDFDPRQPTCYVLEGLVHYLPEATLDRLIAALSPVARVLISFIDPAMIPRASVVFTSLVKVVREVPRQCFTAETLAARFAPAGFALTGHWTFADQVRAFAPAARGRPVGVSQDVAQLDRA